MEKTIKVYLAGPIFWIFVFTFSFNVFASSSLSYTGRLVTAAGVPIVGPIDIKFDLAYTNAPAAILCTQTITAVALTNGVFHVKLDPDCTPSTLVAVTSQVPVGEALAIRVTDVTNAK